MIKILKKSKDIVALLIIEGGSGGGDFLSDNPYIHKEGTPMGLLLGGG